MRAVRASLLPLVVLLAMAGAPAAASPPGAVPPLPGAVVTPYDPPAVRWGAGHRGVDLAGRPGATVVAPAAGTVAFAGPVAGRPVVVVSHGETRTTLEPVRASVAVGASVARGDPVGTLVAGHACPADACLHWGLRRGDEYLDPLAWVGAAPVRLLPASAVAAVRGRAAARAALAALAPPAAAGALARPSAGRITSGFGRRFHPIFREWRLHAGVDLSESCGRPIRAAASGRVTHAGFDASGGWRLVIAHGVVGGVRLETVYLHAEGYRVRAGDPVTRGEVVGTVGSTGWSTGCHLHFGTVADGRPVDPEQWIG